ncbi:PucR C-terminal helix-turn-helix domain-containing protein [Bowdeniella nasicola]|uniref:PucR C-terminal helix-turn-helix domain-containing protein n=2 Tax=Bowdeniella nasicola TaxID=208480 RepID=A0A1H3W779_9ACTO|nr:PucR C-terminal helix-turn-helix domain-containing protein [Bowdeniella nasicola]
MLPAMTTLPSRAPTDLPEHVISALRKGSDELKLTAVARMERDLQWWRDLSSEDRSWLGLVAHEGINRFVAWMQLEDDAARPQDIFRVAPPELTRTISLQRTLQVVRLIAEVVEEHSQQHVAPDYRRDLYEAALIYSREVAFSAAGIYARAAESRGQWDARLEAAAIDAIVRGTSPAVMRSRVATVGWKGRNRTFVIVGPAPHQLTESTTAELREACLRATSDALVGIQGDRIIAVLGADENPSKIASLIEHHFGDGTIIIGPSVDDIVKAGTSARAAIAAHQVIRALSAPARIMQADDLLPERVLDGDQLARNTLIDEIYIPLVSAGPVLVETLDSYLGQGRSLEAAARDLYVHPNTVRYRLRRIAQVIGWDPTEAREGQILQIALTVGRLSGGTLPGTAAL